MFSWLRVYGIILCLWCLVLNYIPLPRKCMCMFFVTCCLAVPLSVWLSFYLSLCVCVRLSVCVSCSIYTQTMLSECLATQQHNSIRKLTIMPDFDSWSEAEESGAEVQRYRFCSPCPTSCWPRDPVTPLPTNPIPCCPRAPPLKHSIFSDLQFVRTIPEWPAVVVVA